MGREEVRRNCVGAWRPLGHTAVTSYALRTPNRRHGWARNVRVHLDNFHGAQSSSSRVLNNYSGLTKDLTKRFTHWLKPTLAVCANRFVTSF